MGASFFTWFSGAFTVMAVGDFMEGRGVFWAYAILAVMNTAMAYISRLTPGLPKNQSEEKASNA